MTMLTTQKSTYVFRASGNPMLALLGFDHLEVGPRDKLVIAMDGRPVARHQMASPGFFETMYRLDRDLHAIGPAYSLCYCSQSDAVALHNLASWLWRSRKPAKGDVAQFIAAGLPGLEAWIYRADEAAEKHSPRGRQ